MKWTKHYLLDCVVRAGNTGDQAPSMAPSLMDSAPNFSYDPERSEWWMGSLLGLSERIDVRALLKVEIGSYTKCHVKRYRTFARWA